MSDRIIVAPDVLAWAVRRSGKRADEVAHAADWIAEAKLPTWRQLEKFAAAVHVPIGYLFLAEPPEEQVPLTDFRRVGVRRAQPSVDLLDTIAICLERQAWYEDYAERHGLPDVAWVGGRTVGEDPGVSAGLLRQALDLPVISGPGGRDAAVRDLRHAVEAAGGLVMANGVVGSDTHRRLEIAEFRGFSLGSTLAPLIFLNSRDSAAGQIFTLIHELGHLSLGGSSLDDLADLTQAADDVEQWCNRVASNLLLPEDEFRDRAGDLAADRVEELSRHFKVSTLVVLHRARELGLLSKDAFWAAYRAEESRLASLPARRPATGGDFYRTHRARLGGRFPQALVASTRVGETPYSEAFKLLGVRSAGTYKEIAAQTRGAA